MKKTVSILLLLVSFLSAEIKAQLEDSLQPPERRSYYYLSLRSGLIAGYHFFSSDSAGITLSQPNELHLRFFPKSKKFFRSFLDAELQVNSLLFPKNYLSKGGAFRIGYGKITKSLSHSWRIHVGYQQMLIDKKRIDMLKYRQLLVFGYTFETNGIPLTIDYLYPISDGFQVNATILLMGVKIPIVVFELNKKREDAWDKN